MAEVKVYVQKKLADIEEMRRSQLYKWAIPALVVANVAVIAYYWNKWADTLRCLKTIEQKVEERLIKNLTIKTDYDASLY